MARYKFVCRCTWTWYSSNKNDNACPKCGTVIVGIEQ